MYRNIWYLCSIFFYQGCVDPINEAITLQINEDQEKQSFFIHTPWAEGSIEMRFPETVHENKGFYFIDHDLGIDLIEEVKSKSWHTPYDSLLSYSIETKSGLNWHGQAHVVNDGIELQFKVINATQRTIEGFHPQMCLSLSNSSAFGLTNDLESTFTWQNGKKFSLQDATPSQHDLERPFPWVIMLTKIGVNNYRGDYGQEKGKDAAWWVTNEYADYGIIYKVSRDENYLIGIAWFGSMNIITNGGIPCLHSVPSIHGISIPPNQQYEWIGKIYLMENNPDKLKKKYHSDIEEYKKY